MFKQLTIAGLLFGMLAAVPPAFARDNCGVRETVVAKLQDHHSCRAQRLQANQNVQTMVEVWASEKTGTFTMLLTSPEGVSCVVAIGTDFFTRPTTDAIEGLKG